MSRAKSLLLTGSFFIICCLNLSGLTLYGCSSLAQEPTSDPETTDASPVSETPMPPDVQPDLSAAAWSEEQRGPVSPASVGSVADRLDQWLVLIRADSGIAAQAYADFLDKKPGWPERRAMLARYQSALATRTPDSDLPSLCPREPLSSIKALIRCAAYLPDTASQARRIWRNGADRETDSSLLLVQFSTVLTPEDHWARFQRQIRVRSFGAAGRQILLLPSQKQDLGRVWLALQSGAPEADTQYAGLSASMQNDPLLLFARLRFLRRKARTDEAYTLWQQSGFTAQLHTPSADWTTERLGLARNFLFKRKIPQARTLANDTTLGSSTPAALEAAFLRGWIDLRFLNQPAQAVVAFQVLTKQTSLITRSRGYYWLGRALAAQDQTAQAQQALRIAAAMPTTFYGQLAQSALAGRSDTLLPNGGDIPGLAQALSRLPHLPSGPTTQDDLIEAARLLTQRGDENHAREFLMLAFSRIKGTEGQVSLARLALSVKSYEPAVFAARRTGRLGMALFPEGWPVLVAAAAEGDGLPRGLALGVARQESSFDTRVTSPARAIGLMQLQTATARDVARRAGLSGLNTDADGLKNPATSLTLGRAYLAQLMERFSNIVPVVLSAYNAGPHRTDQWLNSLPLPTPLTQNGLIDWIESLPFEETRSYIQRVEENMALYRILEPSHG